MRIGTLPALLVSVTAVIGAGAVFAASLRPPAFASHRICTTPGTAANRGGFGTVHFTNSCKAAVQPALQLEIAKLHSFEASARGFVAIAARDPGCAIAWWGASMSARGNPLGDSLDTKSLKAGRKLIDRALAIRTATPRETALVGAMDVYYRPYKDQITRARAYAGVMDKIYQDNPGDPDIGALDGLAIIEGVDLDDKTYGRQKRAGAILEAVMRAHPDHPGAAHYLIHAYDYTALAPAAVRAAEAYPGLATASSHAQHMPAHIWSMLGRWDRSIDANRKSSRVADPSSGQDPVKGDIVFEHAFDFIAYARLQKGEDRHVAADLAALKPPPFIVTARYALERGDWASASALPLPKDAFDAAMARFVRGYGAARAGNAGAARVELAALKALRVQVAQGAGEYWGVFVDIYAQTLEAWALMREGKTEEGLAAMRAAAARDDGHEKHIYLENKILAVRESLADMEVETGRPKLALADYQASLRLAPNRYRSYLGAARAATAAGDKPAARGWWSKLLALTAAGDHARPGHAAATAFLAENG